MTQTRRMKAAPFWIALIGLPLFCIYALAESEKVKTSIGASMATPLLILGAFLLLTTLWIGALLATRALADGVLGVLGGVMIATLIGVVSTAHQQRLSRQADEQHAGERARERSRLVEAAEAAHAQDDAGIRNALARPTAYALVESMCALAAADDQPLDEILQGRPEVGRDRWGRAFRVSSPDLFRIAGVAAADQQTSLPMAQAALYVVLSAWAERGDVPQLERWRSAWGDVERLHGLAPTWPPRFQRAMGNGFDGYCDAGTDSRLREYVDALSSAEDEGASMAPPHPPAPPDGVDSVPNSRTDAR